VSASTDAWEWIEARDNVTAATCRLKVPGGWLYRCRTPFEAGAIALAFVPEPRTSTKEGGGPAPTPYWPAIQLPQAQEGRK
jgi:hypothetical protein